jgi:hypothetical protein
VLVPNTAVGAVGTPVNIGEVLLVGVYPNAVVTSVVDSTTDPILVLKDDTAAVLVPEVT